MGLDQGHDRPRRFGRLKVLFALSRPLATGCMGMTQGTYSGRWARILSMIVSYQHVLPVSSGILEGDMTEAKLNKRLKTFSVLGSIEV